MQKIVAILYLLFCIVSSLGPVNPFDITDTLGGNSSPLTLAIQGPFILMLLLSVKVKSKFLRLENVLLWLFVVAYAFSTLMFTEGDIPMSFYVQLLKLVLCVLLFYKLPWYLKSRPKLMAWGFVAFASVSVIIAILYIGGYLDSYYYQSRGRLVLFFENSNSYSARMVISMFFIAYLIIQNPLKWKSWRYSLLATEALLLYIILASGSRGSFIILVIGAFVYLLYLPLRSRVTKGIVIVAVSLIGIGGTAYILNNNKEFSIMERMNETIEAGDDAGRTELSSATLRIWEENPMFGVGAIEFSQQMFWRFRLTHTVHNVYWYILVTSGILGFVVFSVFIVLLGYRTILIRYKEPMALVLYLSMLLIASKTGGALTYIIMWYIFSLSATLSLQCQRK